MSGVANAVAAPELSAEQIRRYARHILLPDVGGTGQKRLLLSAVVVDLGPDMAAEVVALAYLAAAGVGHLLLGGEATAPVTASEAQRGILLGAADVGRPRAQALAERIRDINPDVRVELAAGAPGMPAVPLASLPDVQGLSDAPAAGAHIWLVTGPLDDDVAAALVRGGLRAVQTLSRLLASARA